MRCLTKNESFDLMRDLGFTPDGWTIQWLDGGDNTLQEWQITDSMKLQGRMANAIFNEYPEDVGCMIWLRGWGVWPSSEYPEIWMAIRELHGERREIIEAPGHLFSPAEIPLARGMARLAILFGWDALIFSMRRSFVVTLSHDEFFGVIGAGAETVARLTERFEEAPRS